MLTTTVSRKMLAEKGWRAPQSHGEKEPPMTAQQDADAPAHPRYAVVGAGPAGIYATQGLLTTTPEARVDLIERLPAPFGLIRYGVAPDHGRIKNVIRALEPVLQDPRVRLLANVEFGRDVGLAELRSSYDAVVVATGALRDRPLPVPGAELDGVHSGADFVSWYAGHPDGPTEWPLAARSVAVVGMGNVAVDVARILAKSSGELRSTDMPVQVLAALANSAVEDVHVFGRRGPAQAKFSPLELRELSESTTFDVIVDPADLLDDPVTRAAREASKITDQVVRTVESYAARPPHGRGRRLFLHFWEAPAAVLGSESVVGLRTERTVLDNDGNAVGTGQLTDWPVQAVYPAIGYRSDAAPGLPFDTEHAVVPNVQGRVDGLPDVYVTGWLRRGPVGLIGQTRSDAAEVVASIAADRTAGVWTATSGVDLVDTLAARGHGVVTWSGWELIDDLEQRLGLAQGRERCKVTDRAELLATAGVHRAAPLTIC